MRANLRLLRRWQMATLTQAAPGLAQNGHSAGAHSASNGHEEQQKDVQGAQQSKEARSQVS